MIIDKDMPVSRLTSKGQTTIPVKVREHLDVDAGDRLDFVIRPDGTVELRAGTTKLSALRGILHRKGMRPVSISQMNAAVRKRVGPRR